MSADGCVLLDWLASYRDVESGILKPGRDALRRVRFLSIAPSLDKAHHSVVVRWGRAAVATL